jgi:hypothetical protein
MVHSWQDIALQSAFWWFGFLGLFGITLLPWRSVQLVYRNWAPSRASVIGRICFLLLALAAALAFFAAVACTYDMSRCLLGYHCSANRAGGWLYLGGVGFWYFAFELVAFIVLLTARKLGRVAI